MRGIVYVKQKLALRMQGYIVNFHNYLQIAHKLALRMQGYIFIFYLKNFSKFIFNDSTFSSHINPVLDV